MAKTKTRHALLMLERWIERAAQHMAPQFTTHEYIEKLRELYPADYAHDLTLCTLEYGFPQSRAVLHRAVTQKLHRSSRVRVVDPTESRDSRGKKHRALLWERRDRRSPGSQRPKPFMTGSQLREARLALGLSMTDLARRAGISISSISLWERDKRNMQSVTYEAVEKALAASQAERERAIGLGEAWPPPRPRPTSRKPRKPPPPPPMTAAQLRDARLALGWTKTELARRAGISLASAVVWEQGKTPITRRGYEAIQRALEAGSPSASGPSARGEA